MMDDQLSSADSLEPVNSGCTSNESDNVSPAVNGYDAAQVVEPLQAQGNAVEQAAIAPNDGVEEKQQPELQDASLEPSTDPATKPLPEPLPEHPDVNSDPVVALPAAEAEHEVDSGADATASDSDSAEFRQVADACVAMTTKLDELKDLFSKRLQYDEEKEKIIDRQHQELKGFREGLKANLVQPLLYDIAEAMDAIHKMRDGLVQTDKESDNRLQDIEYMLLDILEKNDVEQVQSQSGSSFVSSRQRMVKFEETTDPAKRKMIASSLAPGYLFGEFTLFKEKVVVYKVVDPPAAVPVRSDDSDASVETAENC